MAEVRKFLTKAETAETLRVTTRTVDRRILDGTLTAVKFGRRILVPIEAINALTQAVT
jgi:excisionase family DNA binding protein